MSTETFIKIMRSHPTLERDLQIVQTLQLPQSCIAAGYVRNYVWDYLHGYYERSPMNDVDVLYYDPDDLREETEKEHEQKLKMLYDYNWSVKNQARMHLRNGDSQYKSIEDAMKRWPETATAIGIGLASDGHLKMYAPHGYEDLMHMIERRSPYFRDVSTYRMRMQNKGWLTRWPRLTVID